MTRPAYPGRVLLTVWCGLCESEGAGKASRLGDVLERDRGGLVWLHAMPAPRAVEAYVDDAGVPRARRAQAAGAPRWAGRRTAPVPYFLAGELPAELPAWCGSHGHGRVSATAIVGQRGSVSANLIRPGRN